MYPKILAGEDINFDEYPLYDGKIPDRNIVYTNRMRRLVNKQKK